MCDFSDYKHGTKGVNGLSFVTRAYRTSHEDVADDVDDTQYANIADRNDGTNSADDVDDMNYANCKEDADDKNGEDDSYCAEDAKN